MIKTENSDLHCSPLNQNYNHKHHERVHSDVKKIFKNTLIFFFSLSLNMLVAFCPSGRCHFAWECSQSSVGILRLRDKPKRDLARDANRDTFELQHWESSYFGANPKPRQIPSSYTKISKGIFLFLLFLVWGNKHIQAPIIGVQTRPKRATSVAPPALASMGGCWRVGFLFWILF